MISLVHGIVPRARHGSAEIVLDQKPPSQKREPSSVFVSGLPCEAHRALELGARSQAGAGDGREPTRGGDENGLKGTWEGKTCGLRA